LGSIFIRIYIGTSDVQEGDNIGDIGGRGNVKNIWDLGGRAIQDLGLDPGS